MHRLTLQRTLDAIDGLRIAGALPSPKGLSVLRLHGANGMKPWLRLALGEEAAVDLERRGRAAYHMGAMLGRGPDHRWQALEADPAEQEAIMLADALSEEASPRSPMWSLLHTVRGRCAAGTAERYLSGVVGLDAPVDKTPVAEACASILGAIARRHGIVLRGEAASLAAWTTVVVDTEVVTHLPATRYRDGSVMEAEGCVCRAEDGREWTLREARDFPDTLRAIFPGARLRLTFNGATSGHGGYLFRVEDLEMLESIAETRSILARHEEAGRRTVELAASRALDMSGRELVAGDTVRLDANCQEADRGSMGRVTRILGDMALVDFGARRNRVPCYANVLEAVG